jgi:hypothetical protein
MLCSRHHPCMDRPSGGLSPLLSGAYSIASGMAHPDLQTCTFCSVNLPKYAWAGTEVKEPRSRHTMNMFLAVPLLSKLFHPGTPQLHDLSGEWLCHLGCRHDQCILSAFRLERLRLAAFPFGDLHVSCVCAPVDADARREFADKSFRFCRIWPQTAAAARLALTNAPLLRPSFWAFAEWDTCML